MRILTATSALPVVIVSINLHNIHIDYLLRLLRVVIAVAPRLAKSAVFAITVPLIVLILQIRYFQLLRVPQIMIVITTLDLDVNW